MKNLKPRNPPWLPSVYDYDLVIAAKAISEGKANAHQQKLFLDWTVQVASGTYDEAYYDTDRDTAYACGRAFVGRQIVKMVNYPPSKMDDLRREKNERPSRSNTEQP